MHRLGKNETALRTKDTVGTNLLYPNRSKHFEKSTIKKRHKKALKNELSPTFRDLQFAPYFLNAARGNQVAMHRHWRGLRQSSVAMSARYVHPSEDAVLATGSTRVYRQRRSFIRRLQRKMGGVHSLEVPFSRHYYAVQCRLKNHQMFQVGIGIGVC